MAHPDKDAERARWKKSVERIGGSAPWLKARDVQHYKAKVFKSGNSLALRLPAGVGLKPGTEMNLRVENGDHFSFEAGEPRRRKFDIAKVWGSATGLELLRPEDRLFEERRLLWDEDESGTPE
jgi:antitoxin VapB